MKLDDIRQFEAEYGPAGTPDRRQKMLEYFQAKGLSGDNLYQELEMSYRFVQTHPDISLTSHPLSLHSHSFYEILYCCTSCGVEYLVGPDRYRLQRGDIILVPPGVSHRPLMPEVLPEPYKRYVLWISQEFSQRLGQTLASDRIPLQTVPHLLRTAGTRWEGLGDIFHRGIQESMDQEPFWETALMGNTAFLVSQLSRAMTDRGSSKLRAEAPELLDQVMGYVEAHLAEKITLADTAQHFFVSQSTISQTFRQKMGVSFYRCVTQRRLIAAKALILQGLPLEAVNEQVGFSDYSTFYRAFKQEYGISPRQFRKLRETAQI